MIYKLSSIFAVFASSCAQMMLKRAVQEQYKPFWRQYLNVWVVGGYAILLGALMLNIFCMSRGVLVKELSIFESFSLLFVPVLSWACFREPISFRKWVAIVLVLGGAIVFFS